MQKIIDENADTLKTGSGNKKGINFAALQKLLITKEELNKDGEQQADEADLQVSTLQKLYTFLNHLQNHPKAFKILQENLVSSEEPVAWKAWHFNSKFWENSDDVICKVYVITF